jgi:hypothetical protein
MAASEKEAADFINKLDIQKRLFDESIVDIGTHTFKRDVSVLLYFHFRFRNPDSQQRSAYLSWCTNLQNGVFNVKKGDSINTYVGRVLDVLKTEGIDISNTYTKIPVISVMDDLVIKKLGDIPAFSDQRLRKSTDVKIVGTDTAYDTGRDVCGVDYIIYCVKHATEPHGLQWINENSLLRFFGFSSIPECAERGISVRQYQQFAEYVKCIDLTVFDVFGELVVQYRAPTHASIHMVFLVDNEHIYPVDTKWKNFVVTHQKFKLMPGDYSFRFDKYHVVRFPVKAKHEADGLYLSRLNEFRNGEQYQDLVRGVSNAAKIVLVDHTDLLELSKDVLNVTRTKICAPKIDNRRLVQFIHPITNQVYILSDDVCGRREVADTMFKLTKYPSFAFANQSYTALANTMFRVLYGTLPESTYSDQMISIFREYDILPYIRAFNSAYWNDHKDELVSCDIRYCYASIFLDNAMPYGVYSALDEIEVYDKRDIGPGMYYVYVKGNENGAVIMKPELVLCNKWYEDVQVKYFLERGYITKNDIVYMLVPSKQLASDYFVPFIRYLMRHFDPQSFKKLFCCFNGDLNHRWCKHTSCATTTSMTEAYIMAKTDPNIHLYSWDNDSLYLLTKQSKEICYRGHIPVYRRIIASAYILLDRMYDDIVGPDTTVVAINTDCIVCKNPKVCLPPKTDARIGEYGYEEPDAFQRKPIRGKQSYVVRKSFTLADDPYSVHRQVVVTDSEESLAGKLVIGPGGCGKTELNTNVMKIAQQRDLSVMIVSHTNTAVATIKDRCKAKGFNMDKQCKTLTSFIGSDKKSDITHEKTLSKYELVWNDEVFVTQAKDIVAMFHAKMINPQLQFILSGDQWQSTPPDSFKGMWYDYVNCRAIRYITDNRLMTMSYIPASGRYDSDLFNELEYLKENRCLSQNWIRTDFDAEIAECSPVIVCTEHLDSDHQLVDITVARDGCDVFSVFDDTSKSDLIVAQSNITLRKFRYRPQNICFTNTRRIMMNDLCFSIESSGRNVYELQGRNPFFGLPNAIAVFGRYRNEFDGEYEGYCEIREADLVRKAHQQRSMIRKYYVGMPLIAYENDIGNGIQNSSLYCILSLDVATGRFTVVKKDKSDAYVDHEKRTTTTNYDDVRPRIILPLKKLSLFDYAYCVTACKLQSATVHGDVNIHETDSMDLRLLYTAISRATAFRSVHLRYTPRYFKVTTPPNKALTRPITCSLNTYCPGRIYMLTSTDSGDHRFYIGSTKRSIDVRLQEHIEAAKVNGKTGSLKNGFINDVINSGHTVKMVLLAEYMFPQTNKLKIKDLEVVEYEYIYYYRRLYPDDIVNKVCPLELKREGRICMDELYKQIETRGRKRLRSLDVLAGEVDVKRMKEVVAFDPIDCVDKRAFMCRVNKIRKYFYYNSCSKDEALMAAITWRNNQLSNLIN